MQTADSSQKSRTTRPRLGDVLLQKGVITQDQLNAAIAGQKTSGKKLGLMLVETGAITSERLAYALAEQLHLPMVSLRGYAFKDELTKLLPQAVARRLQALVLQDKGGTLEVTVADPFDLQIYDELVRVLNRDVSMAVSPSDQIVVALDRVYRRTEEISGLARALEKDIGETFNFGLVGTGEAADDAPVVRFLQTVFEDALQANASDIHVEPQEGEVVIRFRIDGVMHMQTRADKRISGALAQRLKLMSGLDISERRMPQDGRFNVPVRGVPLDVRISTMPSQFGESVVMRLLRQTAGVTELASLGMPAHILERMQFLLQQASGMVLVTGPTGSGKTTTLYAAMAALDTTSLKVLTVEDPVEYRLAGIIQTQVNEKIDLSFAKVLRASLRQDPDVILVGEVRDSETAEIALRAAITGHMVLSTLHTRDAASTPLRLFDMGIPHYMVATSLQAVLAQRLVRLVCDVCAQPAVLPPALQQWVDRMLPLQDPPFQSRIGRGCPSCNHSGYSGRTGVYEMFEMDAELIQIAARGDPAAFSDLAYRRMAGRTLGHHALELAARGRTTAAEAMRVASQLDG